MASINLGYIEESDELDYEQNYVNYYLESGFYSQMIKLPKKYYPTSRSMLYKNWGLLGLVTLFDFYKLSAIFWTIYIISQTWEDYIDHSELFTEIVAVIVIAAIFAIFSIPMYLIIRFVLAMSIKLIRWKDFRNMTFSEIYSTSLIVLNAVKSKNPYAFEKRNESWPDLEHFRPDIFDEIPEALRSKSKYEFHRTWGIASYFHNHIVFPASAIIVFSMMMSMDSSNMFIRFLSVMTLFLVVYMIIKHKLILNLYYKKIWIEGYSMSSSDVKMYMAETRRFVYSLEPNLYTRLKLSLYTVYEKKTLEMKESFKLPKFSLKKIQFVIPKNTRNAQERKELSNLLDISEYEKELGL